MQFERFLRMLELFKSLYVFEWWFRQFMERIKLIIEHNLECNLNFSFALDHSLLIEKSTNYLKYQYRLQCFIDVQLLYIYFISSQWFLRPNQPRYQFMAITSTGSTGTQILSKEQVKQMEALGKLLRVILPGQRAWKLYPGMYRQVRVLTVLVTREISKAFITKLQSF